MKKISKYIFGGILFILFLILDSSGLEFKSNVQKLKDFANGRTAHLKFKTVTSNDSQKMKK